MSEHRCRSCLWFSEPLWPEHRPACLWTHHNAPIWVRQRHYVSAADAEKCPAYENAFAEVGLKAAERDVSGEDVKT